MNKFIGSLGGKKFIVALIGLIAVVVSAKGGVDLKPETLDKVITAIGTITGCFAVGQGVADGLSGGKTSSVAANAAAEAAAAPVEVKPSSGDVG